jgi:hypothetical protein
MTHFVCTCICRSCIYISLIFVHSRVLLMWDICFFIETSRCSANTFKKEANIVR